MKSARIECERHQILHKTLSPRPRRTQHRLSEVVVYTTLAYTYRPKQRQSALFRPILTAKVTPANQNDQEDPCPTWEPIAQAAWAQIHIFVEMERGPARFSGKSTKVLGNFRIVTWILDTGAVILNGPLNGKCRWEPIAGNSHFRQFTGVDGQTIGFRFCSAVEAHASSRFLAGVIDAEEDVRAEMNALVEPETTAVTQKILSPFQLELGILRINQFRSKHSYHPCSSPKPKLVVSDPVNMFLDSTSMEQTNSSKKSGCAPASHDEDSNNQDQAPRQPEISAVDDHSDLVPLLADGNDAYETRISSPYKTRQELHVTYNIQHARYEGLPPAWRALNIQFGLPLEAVPKRFVDGYAAKIPAVLQMMKDRLLMSGGASIEGIFRLAPDRDECAAVKRAINDGTFDGCPDVNVIANLIKVWFRELPRGLFNTVPEKHIYHVCELEEDVAVLESVNEFPTMYRSLVLWVLDLMVEIVRNEHVNKMSAKNMAIVMAPNLFIITSENPMFALTMSQKVVDFTLVLLSARLHQTVEEKMAVEMTDA